MPLDLRNKAQVQAAFSSLTSTASTDTYLILRVNANVLEVYATGVGFQAMTSKLQSTMELYVYLRVTAVQAAENVTSRRSCTCSISFVGTGMKAIDKARASSNRIEVERLFLGIAASFSTTTATSPSMADIARNLRASGNSEMRSATQFQFSPYESVYAANL